MEESTQQSKLGKYKWLIGALTLLVLVLLALVIILASVLTKTESPSKDDQTNTTAKQETETIDSVKSYELIPKKITESVANSYSIDIQYPQLKIKDGSDTFAEEFNTVLSDFASIQAQNIRSLEINELAAGGNSIVLDYTVTYNKDGIVSILLLGSAYTGGAHGSSVVQTYVYNVSMGKFMGLDDLFTQDNILTVVSDYCLSYLHSQEGFESDWVNRGASADAANYQLFTITPEGLKIIFSEYQVAAYAIGNVEVLIPWAELPASVL